MNLPKKKFNTSFPTPPNKSSAPKLINLWTALIAVLALYLIWDIAINKGRGSWRMFVPKEKPVTAPEAAAVKPKEATTTEPAATPEKVAEAPQPSAEKVAEMDGIKKITPEAPKETPTKPTSANH